MSILHEWVCVGKDRKRLARFVSCFFLPLVLLASPEAVYPQDKSSNQSYYYLFACQAEPRYYQSNSDTSLQALRTKMFTSKKTVVKKPSAPKLPPSELNALIDKYGAEYHVDAGLLKRMAFCESSYNPNAINGPYAGLYQFSSSTWSATRRRMGLSQDPQLRFNVEEAVKTTAYKISKEGVGAWPVCGKR